VVPVSVAENVGVWPITGLLLASFSVTVIVEVAEPSATTGPDPVMVEFVAEAPPAVNVTVPSDLETGEVMAKVFISATSEVSVQVDSPFASETEQAP
jgi:hypothetical protein